MVAGVCPAGRETPPFLASLQGHVVLPNPLDTVLFTNEKPPACGQLGREGGHARSRIRFLMSL